ncbi:MAG: ABC transporter substrate-binding protein [Hyphomicrobiales bacterium]
MMNLKKLAIGAVAAATMITGAAVTTTTAQAEDGIYVPILSYRTGPFAGSGIPIANGMNDYLNMINERDGGVNGVKLVVEECETSYNAQKGVECYEATKGKGAVVYNPYSTGITLQLIPKAPVDKIPVLSMGYGLSAAAIGEKFPWTFNPPATYWSQASAILKYIGAQEGGDLSALKGKKIGFIYLDVGYGKEPIPLLEKMAAEHGFELLLVPVGVKEMQSQSSHWLTVRKEKPDYMVMWGWGAMNPTAVKEAAKIRFPMDKFIGVWWSGSDDDARPAGDAAIGYKSTNFHSTGADFPALQDILTHVVKTGKSQVSDESKVGENFYNRGVFNSVIIVEAIKKAQEISGKKVINGEDMRAGLEALDLTAAHLESIGLGGFTNPMKISCSDHAGAHDIFIQKWDGKGWVKDSDWISPLKDTVRPLLAEAADKYVAEQTDWQTQKCG